MEIWEVDKLFLFIAFVVPGFVSLKCYETICQKPQRDASNQLIDAITYSCINYALLFFPIYLVESGEFRTEYPKTYIAFYAFVLLVAPIVWALAFRYMRATKFLQRLLPHPTAKPWDFVFQQRVPYWVLVTLKNGNKYGGMFGLNSFVSSSPAPEQIYLEKHWKLSETGWLQEERKDSAGIIIVCADIEAVEFRNLYYERKTP